MSSQLHAAAAGHLGVQPLLALGYSQLFSNPSGFAEIGARFDDGPLHLGWHLHFAERFDQSGGLPFITSTMLRALRHTPLGLRSPPHGPVCRWAVFFGATWISLNVSAGAKPSPDAPTVRVGTTVPLRPVATPTTRLSVFGTFSASAPS